MRIAFNLVRDHTKSLKFRFWKTVAASTVDVEDLSQYVPSRSELSGSAVAGSGESADDSGCFEEAYSPGKEASLVMRFVEEMELGGDCGSDRECRF